MRCENCGELLKESQTFDKAGTAKEEMEGSVTCGNCGQVRKNITKPQ